ncbi:MAG: NAD(P)/FAD-dependent oxidoreductase [Deltaproteobacteria bacterium]|nr:NAD(P)/FAD-dependent oxidoreductase [Deltaproteobacteria bacterium]
MKKKTSRHISCRDFMKVAAATTAALAVDWKQLEALAAEVGPKSEFPVVVIGGGLGGLSAAAHLARNGFPVTLVEQHNIPGGYATTFDRAGGKFTFDVSLHATMSAKGGLRESLEGAGVLDKVETVELPELCRIITPDYDLIWPQQNPDAIIKQLSDLFPDQAQGIQGFFDEILGILDEALKPFDSDSWWDKLTFPISRRKMWGIRNKTLAEVLDPYVKDPKLRSLLSVYWPYYGLPPSKLSGFYYAIATSAYIRFGGYYIKRRSQDLSYALMDAIEAKGGQVMLETEAEKILMKDGAITGVTLASGKHLKARAVISNASVPATMKMLSQNTEAAKFNSKAREYLKKLDTYRPSLSTFVVWLGLNQEVYRKVKGYEIWIDRDYNPEKAYQGCLACDPNKAGLLVTLYDNAYKGYSKPGTSTVVVMMLSGYEPWKRFEADYFAGRKDAYHKEKERITKALIKEAEKWAIPGLSSMIEVMEAASPLTNIHYTGNPEGAIYGYQQSMDNAYMTRLEQRTPFKGLYLASAWTKPGGGYQPCLGSGAKAFKAMVKDLADI